MKEDEARKKKQFHKKRMEFYRQKEVEAQKEKQKIGFKIGRNK